MTGRALITIPCLIETELVTRHLSVCPRQLLLFRERVGLHRSQQFDTAISTAEKVENGTIGRISHHRLQATADNLLCQIDHRNQCSAIRDDRITAIAQDHSTGVFQDILDVYRGRNTFILSRPSGATGSVRLT